MPSFTHYNRRGDVTAKTDATGALTYQAEYEAFGRRTVETGATADRQKSNTKDEDIPGYANEGFRFRDLETGTFLTRDPAGFVDGPNLYAYVVENPWTKFDPEGLSDKDTAEVAALMNSDPSTSAIGEVAEQRSHVEAGVTTLANGIVETANTVASLNPVQNAITAVTGKSATGDEVSGVEQAAATVAIVAGPAEKLAGKILSDSKALLNATKLEETAKTVSQDFKGGLHGDTKMPTGDGLDSHHMPADSISPTSTDSGTAIQMEKSDHKLTSSYGNSTEAQAYRQQVKDLLNAGRTRDAMATEIKDVRRAASEASGDSTKYNTALQQMLEAGKKRGGIPTKKKP